MSVRDPLGNVGSQYRQHAEIYADQAAANHQQPVPECVLDAFHDAGELLLFAAGNAGTSDSQVHDLGNRKHAHNHRDEI